MRGLAASGLVGALLVAIVPTVSGAQTAASSTSREPLRALKMPPSTAVAERLAAADQTAVDAGQGDDPVGNGILIGALIGTAGAVGITAIAFGGCDSGCEGPSTGATYLAAAAVGAGGGALVGWLIDRAHKRQPTTTTRAVSVRPMMAAHRRGVAVSFTF